MKKLFAVLFLAGLWPALPAAEFPPGYALMTATTVNSFANVLTNDPPIAYSAALTNYVEFSTLHTFQYVFSSTNNGYIALDRSLTGTNWTVVATNEFTSPGGEAEQTMLGKWKYVRVRCFGSNVVATVHYLGARQ